MMMQFEAGKHTKSLLLLCVAILISSTTTAQQQQQQQRQQQQQEQNNTITGGCTLCADGSIPNFEASIGETSCRTIANAVSQTPSTTDLCVMAQLQGYIYCSCPTYPSDSYCSLCDTATEDTENDEYFYNPLSRQNRKKIIPDSNLTCGEVEFVKKESNTNGNASSSLSTCPAAATTVATAEYCGCVETTKRSCSLCNNDSTGSSTMLYQNRLLPPFFTSTCGSLDTYIGSEFTECDTTVYADLIEGIPLSIQDYCGCAGSTDNGSRNITLPLACTDGICGNGQGVRYPNATTRIQSSSIGESDSNVDVVMSCAELETVTKSVTNTTYCSTLLTKQAPQYQSVCCNHTSNSNDVDKNVSSVLPTNTTTVVKSPSRAPTIVSNSNAASSGGVQVFASRYLNIQAILVLLLQILSVLLLTTISLV
jgi:hypothetical protein